MSWIQSAFGSKISPIILFIIVVLAIVFFIAAVLHLVIRFLLRQRFAQSQNYPEMSPSGAFQRQLQQLFHLHDSGLDQAYIDALPVFMYKDIVGLKEPFDCAVCLCEFSDQDKLKLLPLCSHAFHIHCIDTWLLSNSTCPLCRGVICSPGYSFENPVFYFDDMKESEDGSSGAVKQQQACEEDSHSSAAINEKRVFSVRLGKLKSTNNTTSNEKEVGESSNSNLVDGRRCFSMGSFQYVVADLELQVALCPSGRDRGGGGQIGNLTCDGDDGKRINKRGRGESFSVSKIWLWSKKGKFPNSSADARSPNLC